MTLRPTPTSTTPATPAACSGIGCAGLCTDEGLAAAYAEHRSRLVARARRVLGDPHLAEDAVQEAFTRAWRACHTFEEGGPPLVSWLLTITANVAVDLARARARRPPVLRGEQPAVVPAEAAEIDNVSLRDQLGAALGRLSPDHRAAVVELVLRDRPPAEVASDLRVNPVTLRTRLHYALRRLQTQLVLDEAA